MSVLTLIPKAQGERGRRGVGGKGSGHLLKTVSSTCDTHEIATAWLPKQDLRKDNHS